jgi:hypothetical protein
MANGSGPSPNRHGGLRSNSQSTMQATNAIQRLHGVYDPQWGMRDGELQILIKLDSYPHRFCSLSQLFFRCCIPSPNVRVQGSPVRAADRVAEPWWELTCGWANEVAAMGAEALTRTNAQRAVADIGRIGGRGLARRLYRFLGSRGAADAPMTPRQSRRAQRVKPGVARESAAILNSPTARLEVMADTCGCRESSGHKTVLLPRACMGPSMRPETQPTSDATQELARPPSKWEWNALASSQMGLPHSAPSNLAWLQDQTRRRHDHAESIR